MKTLEKTADDTRAKILEAAFRRFGKFGLGKSTMAEIAGDCGMSAGNLYRFYTNKAEIGAACAQHCMRESEKRLMEAVKRHELNAGARVELFILTKLEYLREQFSNHPLHHELVGFISKERPDLAFDHLEKMQSMLAKIIAGGNSNGEFDAPDARASAATILSATMKFITPHFLSMFPIAVLRKEASEVAKLLVRGLKK